MMLNERVEVLRDGKTIFLRVVPIAFNEYDRLMSKPFKRPLKYQAWRVFNYSEGNTADLVVGPGDEITKYIIRYVKRPRPIILGPLDELTINGLSYEDISDKEACELDPILHHEILQRAVELAKASYIRSQDATLTNMLALGQQSQTEMGYVTSSK